MLFVDDQGPHPIVSPLLIHPHSTYHLLPKRQSFMVHHNTKGLPEVSAQDDEIGQQQLWPSPSKKFQEATPHFRSDWKPQHLNQGIWFKHSHTAECFTLYLPRVYPLVFLLLVYTILPDKEDDRAFHCQGINNDRNRTSEMAGPTSMATLHRHKPADQLPTADKAVVPHH